MIFLRFQPQAPNATWLISHVGIYFLFCGVLVTLSLIDFAHFLIPDTISYPGIVIFFLAGFILKDHSWLDRLVGMISGYVILRAISDGYYFLYKREGLGRGDAKLLMLVGSLLGWQSLPLILLIASLVGISYGSMIHWQSRATSKKPFGQTKIPLGPFLSLASLIILMIFAHQNPIDQLAHWLLP